MDKWDDSLPEKAAAAWLKASEQEKQIALARATAIIDQTFKFRGEPRTRLQSLSWPRANAFYDDGRPILGVPKAIKEATSLLAGFLLADVPMTPASMAHVIAILSPVIAPEKPH